MVKHKYSYAGYLIEKIRNSINSEKEPLPNKQDFRLALCEIYSSNKPMKLAEISDALAHYYFKKERHIDYLKAFNQSLTNLNLFSERADEFYNFKNGEIQRFCKNSIENFKHSN